MSPTFSFVTASQGMLSGGSFRNTPLTDEFTFRDYLATHGDQATPIFRPDGGLAHHPVDPGAPDGG